MAEDDKTNALLKAIQGGVPPAPRARMGGGSLADLFGLKEVGSLYYNGETVTLDGYRFTRCRFDNCTLVLTTTNFELVRCVIDQTNSIQFSAPLAKAIRLFAGRYPWAPQQFPEFFVPTAHADGSISITS